MRIILQPVMADLNFETLHSLVKDISKEFKNTKATVDSSSLTQSDIEAVIQSDFDRSRNQWNSPKLLRSLSEKLNPGTNTKRLIIFNADAYSYGLNFVFREVMEELP